MFGELQIVPCGRVWGCGRRGSWPGRLGQSLDLALPMPVRCSVGTCPPGCWHLLWLGDAEKECQVSADSSGPSVGC